MLETDKVYFGDCIQGMALLPDKCVGEVVTDAPYLIAYKTGHRSKDHKFAHEIANDSGEEAKELVAKYIHECFRVLKDNTAAYFFCSSKTIPFFMAQCKDAGFEIKNTIIWVKGNWTAGDLECQYGQMYEPIIYCNKGRREINGKRIPDVWEFKRVASEELLHQNQKPLSVIEQCILKSSGKGDLVLDGFQGSFTTSVACIETHRHYIGWEIDKDYYEIGQKRLDIAKRTLSLF